MEHDTRRAALDRQIRWLTQSTRQTLLELDPERLEAIVRIEPPPGRLLLGAGPAPRALAPRRWRHLWVTDDGEVEHEDHTSPVTLADVRRQP